MEENSKAIGTQVSHEISEEEINTFINGRDPFEHIVNIECGYDDDMVSIIYNKEDRKLVRREAFFPFVWAKNSVCVRMFGGDRKRLSEAMRIFHIGVKKLKYKKNESDTDMPERLEDGFKYMFFAKQKMSFSTFQKFFQLAKTPIYEKGNGNERKPLKEKEFVSVSPVEQYMIYSGRRMFKGYEDYDELKRMCFDIETQGLNPRIHRIEQIGIRTNKGFETVLSIEGNTEEEKNVNEFLAIKEFLTIVRNEAPSIIIGYNSENFDWDFFIVRLEVLGFMSMEDLSLEVGFRQPIYKKKKETVLKLGGEVEYYKPTIIWGISVIDGLHSVRRAQAIDSNMKSANLKYVTKYSSLNKKNRVYVQGDKITDTWNVREKEYAFNDDNGDWYHVDEKHPMKEGYQMVSGRYIVERYLLDDIWETDKVELRYNESNFLLSKLLPTTFQRACTMGTAAIWKLIMLAWSFEHDLAIPAYGDSRAFTGGLSRLLKVGYVDNIVKLDYNSLYPSIILTWGINTPLDISGVMLHLLNYVLSQREKFKKLKKAAGKEAKKIKAKIEECTNGNELPKLEDELQRWESEEKRNDKKQLPFKIFGNSFFGSFGSNTFNWNDNDKAEATTCTGRQSLRLMISWFGQYGYTPIVGDSFTSDTPVFIKYNKNNLIDIKPISELIDERLIEVDELGREYDYSKKPYTVLCRSGWVEPTYVYRHKTDKEIYEVSENGNVIHVTEDHSLFNHEQKKIKPSEINEDTQIEHFKARIKTFSNEIIGSKDYIVFLAKIAAKGTIDRIPTNILNADSETKELFVNELEKITKESGVEISLKNRSKTFIAGYNFIKKYLD